MRAAVLGSGTEAHLEIYFLWKPSPESRDVPFGSNQCFTTRNGQGERNSVLLAHGCLGILLASWAAGCFNITGSDCLASYRAQNDSTWSINRLFARREDDQELRDVSVEPDAGKKGHQKDAQQDKLSSLRDSGNLRNHR